MQKKKLIYLLIAVLVLVGLGWYALSVKENANRSDTELISFAIEDTLSIDKIIITEPNGLEFELKREGDVWVDAKGNCIIQEHVKTIMEAVGKIEFKGYVTENSKTSHINRMSAQAKKIEFFQNGEWSKTWYMGTSTPDHYGQVMLLDSKEDGKSDLPVLMKIKGFNGFIDPRFFADPRKWQCTEIFSLSVNEIEKIEYTDFIAAEKSFSVERNGFQFNVKQNGRPLPTFDTTKVFAYLNRYKKVHFEIPNYSLTPFQVDSLKESQPFAQLQISETNGSVSKLKCFRISGR